MAHHIRSHLCSIIILSALWLVNSHLRISINEHWWVKGVLLGVFSFGYKSCLCALAYLSRCLTCGGVTWMEWLNSPHFFKAYGARHEHECWRSQPPQSRIPLEIQAWCQRANFKNLIAICYTNRSKRVHTAFYEITRGAKLFVSTLLMV